MPGLFWKSILLSVIILLTYLWSASPVLNAYNLQLTGALILLYFGSKLLFRRIAPSFYLTTLVLISIVLLLIFSSGGITSPLFFILDFLLFVVALLLNPSQAAVTSIVLVAIFLFQNYADLNSTTIINLFSLILITPLAVVFSRNYLENLQSQGKISVLKEAIKDEQTDSLLWIATTAKPSLATVLNSLTDIVLYLNSKSNNLLFPKALIEKIKTIQKDLISLYASTNTLEKSIEDSSDKMEL